MPVSSYRHNLPELLRSTDETYLRGLAAISRSSAARNSERRTSSNDSGSDSGDSGNKYSLRYKSHSFTSTSLGLSHRAEELQKKRHDSGCSQSSSSNSSTVASISSTTRGRASRSVETTRPNSTGTGISCQGKDSSPRRLRGTSLTSDKDDSEKVGSLISSPKWSRIKETFESEKKSGKSDNQSMSPTNQKLCKTHSQSTSSLPLLSSSRLHSFDREQALAKTSKVPTFRHSSALASNSELKKSDSDKDFNQIKSTVTRRNGLSRLPTLSSRLDTSSDRSRSNRCSDSYLSCKETKHSTGRYVVSDSDEKYSKQKSPSQCSEADDKCLYGRTGTNSKLSKVRKSSASGLSLCTSGDMKLEDSKNSRLTSVDIKFEPDSFEEKVKALRKRIASTASDYDSIIKVDQNSESIANLSLNNKKNMVPESHSRTSSVSLTRSTSFRQNSVSSYELDYDSSLDSIQKNNSYSHISSVLSSDFITENQSNKTSASLQISKEASNPLENTAEMNKNISRRSQSTLLPCTIDSTHNLSRRSLPKTLDLVNSSIIGSGWKKSNNGAWMKIELNNEISSAIAKSRVALLAQQFNHLSGAKDDSSINVSTSLLSTAGNKIKPQLKSSAALTYDLSPPKYQTTQIFKERSLSLPAGKDPSIPSVRNSLPARECNEDENATKCIPSNSSSRKISLVKQVVQSFEEQLASSNSSESGSSHDNTPTSAGHSKNNPYNFKSPTKVRERISSSSSREHIRADQVKLNNCTKNKSSQGKTSVLSNGNNCYAVPEDVIPKEPIIQSSLVDEKKSKLPSSKARNQSKNAPSKKLSMKKPDLPPPRQPPTPKRPLYINASCSEDSLLAELEEWLVQKYDRKESVSSLASVYSANVVPNQSFLWKELGPKLSNSSENSDGPRNSPKMDGGEQRASDNYYSMPFPHPNSPLKQCQEDHIYMEASFIRPSDRHDETKHLDNASSCDSDEGWVDVSDTELDGSTDSPRNSHMGARLRLRTKSITSQAGSRKSWRESVRELAAAPPLLDTDDETWNHKDYQDIMIWESVEGDDSSLSSTSDHFYEALYEEIVDNSSASGRNEFIPLTRKESLNNGLKRINESPDMSPVTSKDGSLGTTKYDNISGLKKRNSFCEQTSTSPIEEATHLKRNWSLTKNDIQLKLDSKPVLVNACRIVGDICQKGPLCKPKQATSPSALSKRKTLIKFILRQKSNSNASTATLPTNSAPLSGNKKRSRKKGSMFYVRWSTVNRDTRQKSQSESNISQENQSEVDSGNGTSSERLDSSTSPSKVATIKRRQSGSIRRPSSPPPLPPVRGVTVVRSHSGTKSLEILRPPLSRIPQDEKTKSLDSVVVVGDSSNSESQVEPGKPITHLNRSASNSERSSCSSTRASSTSSSCVPGDSPFSLSPKCRSSVASSQSSHSGGSSYINVEDIATKPKSLTLPLTDSDSICSYILINEELKEPLRSPFEEEPLYQFYHKNAKQRATLWQSMATMEEDDHMFREDFSDDYSDTESEDDILKDNGAKSSSKNGHQSPGLQTLKALYPPCNGTTIPSAMDLLRQEGNGGQRTLWCEVPEVRNSGILEKISSHDRKIQEAMFEVITSEASYLKSLNILMDHFMQCPEFSDDFSVNCVLGRRERHILFSDVAPVRDVSARLLADLERRWQENIVLTNICDILYEHASKFFNVYVKYCANQVYQDRILKELKATRPDFIEVLNRLESNPMCQGLDMLSFLMLPMQRITRMPLLVDAIYHRLSPDSPYHSICKLTLAMLNKVVAECNEGARRMERMEEMLVISRQLDFKDCKSIPLISASRWLVKKGELTKIAFDMSNTKRTFGRGSKISKSPIYFFLFTDLLVVAKKKNEESYVVLDYCPRNMVQVFTLEESNVQLPGKMPEGFRNLFQLTMLQNNEFKTVEMVLSCPLESDRTRWMEAVTPPISENPDEKIYEEWDCPQVQCIYPYFAQQPDELSLEESDVVNVLRKMPDGWYEGERLRDGVRGWFPASFSVEIISSHIRARNLRQRYRLLMLSQAYVEEQRKAFMNQTKSK